MWGETRINPKGELKVSFGYQCSGNRGSSFEVSNGYEILPEVQTTSSFSCLSGAGLSANATLANTNICKGLIGAEILPSLDSPNSFRKVPSSPALSRLDILSSSLQGTMSNLSCSPSPPSDHESYLFKPMSAPSRSEGFLKAMEFQVAGGAAGEDRVQAVCSEENGWLFCAIYDGFNGRDAADFLAGTLYETIIFYFSLLGCESRQELSRAEDGLYLDGSFQYTLDDTNTVDEVKFPSIKRSIQDSYFNDINKHGSSGKIELSSDSFRQGVLDSFLRALSHAENEFLYMVEQEMEDRPDLVSVGSCVLVVLLHGNDLYTLNLGDSRAVLATTGESEDMCSNERLKAIQLTDSHTVDNEVEKTKLQCEHPDDPMTVIAGKVKGKLKVTRAFGVGYLKKVGVPYFLSLSLSLVES